MKFQRSLKEEVSVNLTPLIDVIFLLLIFFMVTTTFSRNTNILINLPEASGEAIEQQPFEIEILIAQNGTYSVNGRQLVNSQMETLMRVVAEVSVGDNSIPMIITADANTTHQSVVTAMDAVAQLGFTSIDIATREPDSNNE